MKFRRLLQGNQRGFTLVEMLVVVALIGIIAAGIAMTISQVVAVNSRTSSHMVALRQVQQAGDRISKDALQARTILIDGGSGEILTLMIPYWDDDGDGNQVEKQYKVIYVLDGDKLLQREFFTDPDSGPEYTTIVARYVDEIDIDSPRWIAERVLSVTITATVGMRSETRVYEMEPRPGS